MAIDHGLGGRDSEKSRQRRAKKARHVASVAQASMTKKKEVIFNEDARVEFLTGFRKRKQERRKFGLAMQVLNDSKAKNMKRKQKREAIKLMLESPEDQLAEPENTTEAISEEAVSTFDDNHTVQMFGGAVAVVVDSGIAEEMDRPFTETMAQVPSQGLSHGGKGRRKEPTKLEKALKKASEKMNAPKRRKFSFKKNDGTKLLHKALGAGKVGRHTFKKKSRKGSNSR
jgi:hypothetical protein